MARGFVVVMLEGSDGSLSLATFRSIESQRPLKERNSAANTAMEVMMQPHWPGR